MANKKLYNDHLDVDIDKIKKTLEKNADAGMERSSDSLVTSTFIGSTVPDDWDQTVVALNELDNMFSETQAVDRLKRNINIPQIMLGSDGSLIDVTDKIKPEDLRSDRVSHLRHPGFLTTSEDGRRLPLDRIAAYQLLKQLNTLHFMMELNGTTIGSAAKSIQKMEAALAESDKILEHWKK